jgi:hypothetical protein
VSLCWDCYTECRYDECSYTEGGYDDSGYYEISYTECHYDAVTATANGQTVIMLSRAKSGVVTLSVIILNVVAPQILP